jgi:hypothetical protein
MNPLAGDYEGIAQVIGVVGKIAQLSGGTVQPELHDVLVSTDRTVALATTRADRPGKQLQLKPCPCHPFRERQGDRGRDSLI